ncbi:ABC transporter substrate-binding protein [Terasakiella sp. A23]|uniref:ABC transporter substrate-binding protein n=1 Tax=Terasakiella sp. FCG-A23 TaxID=3080561 RepID=UPI0029553F2F|nr:ABC transporter substrate-binding protein [Terasakiella sp. A23]MDV7340201.1 ABC transporter substrate-binding protein [Terasakiella sp. A23]
MKLFKHIFVSGLFTLCTAILCLALPAQATAPPLKIAFNNPGFQDKGFWKNVSDAMKAAAKKFNIELHIWYGDRDPQKMRENAHQIYQSDIEFDYLILVNEHQQATGFLRNSERKKLKTFYLLNTIRTEQSQKIGHPGQVYKYWIGSLTPDNEKAGAEMAQSLLDFAQTKNWDNPYRLLSISGDNKTPASLYRNRGLDNVMVKSGMFNEQRRAHALWSEDNAKKITQQYLKDFPAPPQLVWAANDNIARGAIEALEAGDQIAGQNFAVAGLNWSNWGLKAVRDGKMTMTHGGHFLGGAWTMVILYDHSQGHTIKAPNAHIRFPMSAITKSNVDAYLQHFENQNWSEIDFKRFSKSFNPQIKAYDFSLPRLFEAHQK